MRSSPIIAVCLVASVISAAASTTTSQTAQRQAVHKSAKKRKPERLKTSTLHVASDPYDAHPSAFENADADRTVSDLMGKEPEARFKFIMEEAYTAKDIDI